MQEPQVQCLGWEYPLEKGMVIHSSIFAWRILLTEDPGGATIYGVAKSWTQLRDWELHVLLKQHRNRVAKWSRKPSFLKS